MRTASYAVEQHPDAPPLDLSQLYVSFAVCNLCGALVHDDLLHGTWHDMQGVRP